MITAEEFVKSNISCSDRPDFERKCELVIEFAKLHVTKALKQASENFKMKIRDDVHELDMNDDWMEVDKDSILNAYPLENIK